MNNEHVEKKNCLLTGNTIDYGSQVSYFFLQVQYCRSSEISKKFISIVKQLYIKLQYAEYIYVCIHTFQLNFL